jgi:hypothetical protein
MSCRLLTRGGGEHLMSNPYGPFLSGSACNPCQGITLLPSMLRDRSVLPEALDPSSKCYNVLPSQDMFQITKILDLFIFIHMTNSLIRRPPT